MTAAPAPRPRRAKRQPEYRLRRSDTHQMTWHQLCITTGRCPATFHYRVHRYAWSELDALRAPAEPHRHVVMPMRDICRKVGVNYHTYLSRRRRGQSVRQALGVDHEDHRAT